MKYKRLFGLLAALITSTSSAWSYGPFNHLCVVDRNWNAIYAQITAVGPLDEWRAVDAVYAGAIADDLGYYDPLNSSLKDLTNETHYIRTGEWIDFLLRSARSEPISNRSLDYAFALGVLSHYAADRMGHYYGTNVVAVSLAGQEHLFGPRMSYERDPTAHKKVEAGFDVISLGLDCRADQLSDRLYSFLQEPGWKDGEQVFGFLVGALRDFYGNYNPSIRVTDLVDSLTFARFYTIRLLKQKEAGPYAWNRISSMQSVSAQQTGGSYNTKTPAEIAKEDQRIERQIQLGVEFKDLAQASSYLPIFADSFRATTNLLTSLLQSAATLRNRQDEELRRNQRIEVDNETFPNLNLDTNELSMSGRYDLADCTSEQLIANGDSHTGQHVSYPPRTGDLEPFFQAGKVARSSFEVTASPDNATLQMQLKKMADAIQLEHNLTTNALAPDERWSQTRIVHQISTDAGGCPNVSGAIPFGRGNDICIGPGVVYWRGNIRAISVLFAASAAARLAPVAVGKQGNSVSDRELAERLEAIDSFRLCDTNKPGGYLDAGLCRDGEPSSPNTLPTLVCVGLN